MVKSEWSDITGFESIPALESYLAEHNLELGETTQTILYHNEPAAPAARPARPDDDGFRFRIGDHVQFTRSSHMVHRAMLGQTGTIVYAEPCCDGSIKYLIQLDPYTEARFIVDHCHDGDGRTPDCNGYWAYEEEISLSDPDIIDVDGLRLGDRVEMVDSRENPLGRIGTIVVLNSEFDIGVRFDNFTTGHDLGEGDGSHNGWWCYASQLRRVA